MSDTHEKDVTDYDPNDKYYQWARHNLDVVRDWAAKGLSARKMAELCHVTTGTFRRWCKRHPELELAIAEGRQEAITAVECALLKKATGYEVPYEDTMETMDELGRVTSTITRHGNRHVAPDTKAIEFFLKNRAPDKWNRSSNELQVTGGVLVIPEAKREDWEKQVANSQKELQESAKDAAEKLLGSIGEE